MVLSKSPVLKVQTLLWPIFASGSKPQQNSAHIDFVDARRPTVATHAVASRGRPSLAAVPLPFHAAVGHPDAVTHAIATHLRATESVVPEGAVNLLYAWWAAAVGGAGYSLRQRQGRRRRPGGVATSAQAQRAAGVVFSASYPEIVHLVPLGMQNPAFGHASHMGMTPGGHRISHAGESGSQGSWVHHGTQLLSAQLVGAAEGHNAQTAASSCTPCRPVETSNEDSGSVSDTGSRLSTESPHELWPATPESTPPQSPRRESPMWHSAPSETPTSASSSMSGWVCPTPDNPRSWQPPPPAPMIQQPVSEATQKDTQTGTAKGNEKCSKLSSKEADVAMKQLKNGESQEQRAVLDWVIKSAWPLCLTRHGCRVVQVALEVAGQSDRLTLADALRGNVLEALKSPHANHVLQKCIKLLPSEQLHFVPVELVGQARKLAQHPFGCRVLQRIIEHYEGLQTSALVEEVITGDAVELCKHSYGNYVLQHIFEFGMRPQISRLAAAMMPKARELARHWCGSHVVEKALLFCDKKSKARTSVRTCTKQ